MKSPLNPMVVTMVGCENHCVRFELLKTLGFLSRSTTFSVQLDLRFLSLITCNIRSHWSFGLLLHLLSSSRANNISWQWPSIFSGSQTCILNGRFILNGWAIKFFYSKMAPCLFAWLICHLQGGWVEFHFKVPASFSNMHAQFLGMSPRTSSYAKV